jgi:hypothetical protein
MSRHYLGGIPLPIRILLAPLSVAAYLTAWVMEESEWRDGSFEAVYI